MATVDDRPIDRPYIRETFGWARMSEVDWEAVHRKHRSAMRKLDYPHLFPEADFKALNRTAAEVMKFLTENGR